MPTLTRSYARWVLIGAAIIAVAAWTPGPILTAGSPHHDPTAARWILGCFGALCIAADPIEMVVRAVRSRWMAAR